MNRFASENRCIIGVKTENRFASLMDLEENESTSVEEEWKDFKDIVINVAKEVLDKRVQPKKKPWFTEEIAETMEKRRKAKSDPVLYRQLNRRIQKMCRKAKEDWMKEQCDEIENLERNHAYRTLHQRIKNMTKLKKGLTNGGGIMDKNGNMLYETEDMKRRWIEYIDELFDDVKSEHMPDIREDMEVTEINMEEMVHAIQKMPLGKATGEDRVAAEMLNVLGQTGKKKLLHLLNNIEVRADARRVFEVRFYCPSEES